MKIYIAMSEGEVIAASKNKERAKQACQENELSSKLVWEHGNLAAATEAYIAHGGSGGIYIVQPIKLT